MKTDGESIVDEHLRERREGAAKEEREFRECSAPQKLDRCIMEG